MILGSKPWIWMGAAFIALAGYCVANAEGDRARSAPIAAVPPVIHADEGDAMAFTPPPPATAEPSATRAEYFLAAHGIELTLKPFFVTTVLARGT